MKGIYLTAEAKQEIEAEIKKFEKELIEEVNPFINTSINAELDIYRKILSSATILPVEESWDEFYNNSDSLYNPAHYINGVIIQSKQ
jgi:hypothetical protein